MCSRLPDAKMLGGMPRLEAEYALYAEGALGTIPELYVRSEYRSQGVGKMQRHSEGICRIERLATHCPKGQLHMNMVRAYSTWIFISSEKSILPDGRWKKPALSAFSVP